MSVMCAVPKRAPVLSCDACSWLLKAFLNQRKREREYAAKNKVTLLSLTEFINLLEK